MTQQGQRACPADGKAKAYSSAGLLGDLDKEPVAPVVVATIVGRQFFCQLASPIRSSTNGESGIGPTFQYVVQWRTPPRRRGRWLFECHGGTLRAPQLSPYKFSEYQSEPTKSEFRCRFDFFSGGGSCLGCSWRHQIVLARAATPSCSPGSVPAWSIRWANLRKLSQFICKSSSNDDSVQTNTMKVSAACLLLFSSFAAGQTCSGLRKGRCRRTAGCEWIDRTCVSSSPPPLPEEEDPPPVTCSTPTTSVTFGYSDTGSYDVALDLDVLPGNNLSTCCWIHKAVNFICSVPLTLFFLFIRIRSTLPQCKEHLGVRHHW